MSEPLTPESVELRHWVLKRARFAEGGEFDRELVRRLASLLAARVAPSDGLREAVEALPSFRDRDDMPWPWVSRRAVLDIIDRAALATTGQPEPSPRHDEDCVLRPDHEGPCYPPAQPEDTRTADPGGLPPSAHTESCAVWGGVCDCREGVGSGVQTDCPLEGVHNHSFRGPHTFREWYPAFTPEATAPDEEGAKP
jgi:hypothetical protein